MSKHTPGPWKIARGITLHGQKFDVAIVAGGKSPKLIADMQSDEWSRKESLADAERIVACVDACEGLADPGSITELIQAAKFALETYEHSGCEHAVCPLCDLKRALFLMRVKRA